MRLALGRAFFVFLSLALLRLLKPQDEFVHVMPDRGFGHLRIPGSDGTGGRQVQTPDLLT